MAVVGNGIHMTILLYILSFLAFVVVGFVLLLLGFLHAITTEKDEDDENNQDDERDGSSVHVPRASTFLDGKKQAEIFESRKLKKT
jgi:hypothetical protein